jgi:hypothetical protein
LSTVPEVFRVSSEYHPLDAPSEFTYTVPAIAEPATATTAAIPTIEEMKVLLRI